MSNLSKHRVFYDTGEIKQEAKNFQGYLFADIDLRKSKEPISFYRSDFRSTKFSNYHLFKNNFDRADFIDSYLSDGTIENCTFGSDFINTLFHQSLITNNSFESCTLTNCRFNECNFSGGTFKEITMRECKFSNCTFDQVGFEMNTIDEITFKNCRFENMDFSNMTAINLYFINCSFNDFTIDPDYLGSCFVIGDFFGQTNFIYRGHKLDLFDEQKELVEGFINLYQDTNRYYELINLYFLQNNLTGSLSEDILKVIPSVFREENDLVKDYHLKKILDLLKFYLASDKIDLKTYFIMISVIDQSLAAEKDQSYLMLITNKLNFLKLSLENEALRRMQGDNGVDDRVVLMQIELGINEIERAEKMVTQYFEQEAFGSYSPDKFYQVISIRPGSVIVEILCYAFLAIPLSMIVKRTMSNITDTIFEYKFKKTGIKMLEQAKSAKDINAVKKVYYDSKVKEGAIISKGGKEDLTDVLKSLKVFVNTID